MRLRQETILVVDDEESDRSFMAHLLRRQGYRVLLAGNYYDARAKAQACVKRIRLVVTDVALPGSNGFELAQSLMELMGPDVDILFTSGEAGSRMLRYYGLVKTDAHFLAKPFLGDELVKRVAHLLASKEHLHQLAFAS